MIPRLPSILGLLIALSFSGLASGQTPPDDSGVYHLITVVGNPPTPGCAQMQQALASDAMKRIVASCKNFAFTPTDALYQERFREALPAEDAPVIALARPDGGVIYKASGPAISTGERLASELTRVAQADQQFFGGDRPRLLPLNDRPRLIPDSVVVAPTINLPPYTVAAVLVILALFVFGFLTLGAVGLYIFLNR
jgi:hypothetical protein